MVLGHNYVQMKQSLLWDGTKEHLHVLLQFTSGKVTQNATD